MISSRNHRKGERGQVLILCALCLIVLLLFVGLAIDFGMAYVTRAKLGKAVDAAALTGARYSAQSAAATIAQSAFAMNYGAVTPVPTISIDSTSDPTATLVNVSATATINTAFIGLLPQFKTLNVSSSAQGKAARVEMTLILDNSGSMGTDGGSTYLPSSVTDFINYFDNTYDSVALVSFNIPATLNLAMTTGNFQSDVISDTKNLKPNLSTFSDGALQAAFTQEMQTVSGNPKKVVVFFTDGGANTIQNAVTCGAGSIAASQTWDLGGQDPPSTDVALMNTSSGSTKCSLSAGNCCKGSPQFPSASQSNSVLLPWTATGYSGPSAPWSSGTVMVPLNYTNVQADAFYRAVGDANAMRAQGITVYSIGLGSAPDGAPDKSFLCQIANDPTCSPTYDSTKPAGVMAWAAAGTDLDQAFQTIATIIRLRLAQ